MDVDRMKMAVDLAKKAYELDEIPVGCVIFYNDELVGCGYNRKEHGKNAILHAEMMAISEACRKLNSWRLDDCCLYVTLEPCMMCMGAIKQARISRVVYGVDNYAFGYLRKLEDGKLVVKKGILKEECLELLSNFFKSKRKGE